MPLGNSIISLSITSLRPSMRATPSPVSRTTPTLLLVVDVFSSSIFDSISSSMVLMVLNFIKVRVESVGGGCARFRPRHHFRRGPAFRQEVGDQREIQLRGRCHICSSDLSQFLSVSRSPLRSRSRLWHGASPVRAGANAYSFLARQCNCAPFVSRAN